jgi:hypothetical protein
MLAGCRIAGQRRRAVRGERRAQRRLEGEEELLVATVYPEAGSCRWRLTGIDAVPCPSHPGAGAGLDEPGRCDRRAHHGGQAVRHRGAEARVPASDCHRRGVRHRDRAGRRPGPAEHGDDRITGRPASCRSTTSACGCRRSWADGWRGLRAGNLNLPVWRRRVLYICLTSALAKRRAGNHAERQLP